MAKNRNLFDVNRPFWFDGQNINEALFCGEFLQSHKILFSNGAFFTPDGRVTDDLPLRGEVRRFNRAAAFGPLFSHRPPAGAYFPET